MFCILQPADAPPTFGAVECWKKFRLVSYEDSAGGVLSLTAPMTTSMLQFLSDVIGNGTSSWFIGDILIPRPIGAGQAFKGHMCYSNCSLHQMSIIMSLGDRLENKFAFTYYQKHIREEDLPPLSEVERVLQNSDIPNVLRLSVPNALKIVHDSPDICVDRMDLI